MFSIREIHKRYANPTDGSGSVWTAACHPGFVKTDLTEGAKSQVFVFNSGLWKLMMATGLDTAPQKSAFGSVYTASSPDLKGGNYMVPVAKVGTSSRSSKNAELATKLCD